MSSEITRACDADRERFIEHLNWLYEKGYLNQAEVEGMRSRILLARSLNVLEASLDGFPQPEKPQPETPVSRRDWGVPRNFVPPCAAAAFTGILVAVIPVTALAHRGDALSNVLSAASVVTGLAVVFTALLVTLWAGLSWNDIGVAERERRRAEQKRR